MVSFDKLHSPGIPSDVKLLTNRVEDRFSSDGCRQLNIDPGYISPAHLILATGRVYASPLSSEWYLCRPDVDFHGGNVPSPLMDLSRLCGTGSNVPVE